MVRKANKSSWSGFPLTDTHVAWSVKALNVVYLNICVELTIGVTSLTAETLRIN